MEVDSVCEELVDARAEIENLKAKLSESLKEVHNEKLAKTHELNLKIEKQGRELIERADEVSLFRQLYEDTQCRMKEKEDIVNNLKSANEKLRLVSDSKFKRVEAEKKDLAGTLEAATVNSMKQQESICGLKEEMESLKEALSFFQRKCSEAEEKARAILEFGKKGDMLLTSEEEERRMVKDQLKWKLEQFKHLEDAHEKLREQFHAGKKEWDVEKCALLDELVCLQTRFQSQTRISEDLENRLNMYSHALANEESRRRCLEVQLSESRSCLENISSECEEVKSKIENLNFERDREIATLRSSLASRGALYKEMEYTVAKLERENTDLLESLKELRETQINEAGRFSSLGKTKSKLKSFEKLQRGCCSKKIRVKEEEWCSEMQKLAENPNDHFSELNKLRAKEKEWCSEMQKLSGNLSDCISELNTKYISIEELKRELDGCHSMILELNFKNEESCIMLLVLRRGFSEAILTFGAQNVDPCENERQEEHISFLLQQLEQRDNEMLRVQMKMEEESKELESLLLKKTEALDAKEQYEIVMMKDLERHKTMLEESLASQTQSQNRELKSEEKAREVRDAFATVKSELQERIRNENEMESLRDNAANMEEKLREIRVAFDVVKSELEERICEGNELEFEVQVWKSNSERLECELEEEHNRCREIAASLLAQVEVEETLKHKNGSLIGAVEEKDGTIVSLQNQLALLNGELHNTWSESMKMESERVKEKDRIIVEINAAMDALKQKVEMLEEALSCLRHEWEKMRAELGEKEAEIEEKDIFIRRSRQRLEKMKVELGQKEGEVKDLKCAVEDCEKAEDEKRSLVNEMKGLRYEKERLLDWVENLWEKNNQYLNDNMELVAGMLKKVNGERACENSPRKENFALCCASPVAIKAPAAPTMSHQRSPFRVLNE